MQKNIHNFAQRDDNNYHSTMKDYANNFPAAAINENKHKSYFTNVPEPVKIYNTAEFKEFETYPGPRFESLQPTKRSFLRGNRKYLLIGLIVGIAAILITIVIVVIEVNLSSSKNVSSTAYNSTLSMLPNTDYISTKTASSSKVTTFTSKSSSFSSTTLALTTTVAAPIVTYPFTTTRGLILNPTVSALDSAGVSHRFDLSLIQNQAVGNLFTNNSRASFYFNVQGSVDLKNITSPVGFTNLCAGSIQACQIDPIAFVLYPIGNLTQSSVAIITSTSGITGVKLVYGELDENIFCFYLLKEIFRTNYKHTWHSVRKAIG
ncbi:hypothetical protein HK096_008893, partial [Nowakowskiella sp. JEL0078]